MYYYVHSGYDKYILYLTNGVTEDTPFMLEYLNKVAQMCCSKECFDKYIPEPIREDLLFKHTTYLTRNMCLKISQNEIDRFYELVYFYIGMRQL